MKMLSVGKLLSKPEDANLMYSGSPSESTLARNSRNPSESTFSSIQLRWLSYMPLAGSDRRSVGGKRTYEGHRAQPEGKDVTVQRCRDLPTPATTRPGDGRRARARRSRETAATAQRAPSSPGRCGVADVAAPAGMREAGAPGHARRQVQSHAAMIALDSACSIANSRSRWYCSAQRSARAPVPKLSWL